MTEQRKLPLYLDKLKVDVDETGLTSTYFQIFDIKDVYGKGIHTITMRGSTHLKRGSIIRLEILDEQGYSIPINVPPLQGFENELLPMRRFTFEILDDTFNGVGKIVMVGVLKDGRTVKYTRQFVINPALKTQTLIDREDWAVSVFYNIGDVVQFNGSSYVCILSHESDVNNVPPNTVYWRLFSSGGLSINLSSEATVIPFTQFGIGDYAGASTTVSVFRGTENVTSQSVITVASFSPELTGSFVNNTFTVTEIPSVFNGFVEFNATIDSASLSKFYNVSAVRDGTSGDIGLSLLYKGLWDGAETYQSTNISTDVVLHSGSYYYVKTGSVVSINDEPLGTTWNEFDGQFESVATDILLAQDVTIRRKLTMGDASQEGSPYGTSGIIQSLGGIDVNGDVTFDQGDIVNRFYKLDYTGIFAISGSIGGFGLNSNKLYSGFGNYNNANTPFYVNSNDESFSLGNKLSYSASVLTVEGVINITGGNGATQDFVNNATSSLSGSINTTINSVSSSFDTTIGSVSSSFTVTADNLDERIFTDANGLINKTPNPSGTGLFLGSTHLGYYSGSQWITYMDNQGDFYLTGSNGFLVWDSSATSLNIKGAIVATTGSIDGNLTVGSNANGFIISGVDSIFKLNGLVGSETYDLIKIGKLSTSELDIDTLSGLSNNLFNATVGTSTTASVGGLITASAEFSGHGSPSLFFKVQSFSSDTSGISNTTSSWSVFNSAPFTVIPNQNTYINLSYGSAVFGSYKFLVDIVRSSDNVVLYTSPTYQKSSIYPEQYALSLNLTHDFSNIVSDTSVRLRIKAWVIGYSGDPNEIILRIPLIVNETSVSDGGFTWRYNNTVDTSVKIAPNLVRIGNDGTVSYISSNRFMSMTPARAEFRGDYIQGDVGTFGTMNVDVLNAFQLNVASTSTTLFLDQGQVRLTAEPTIPSVYKNKVIISDNNGILTSSGITTSSLNYLSGVTSDIQTQIDSKVPLTRNLTFNVSNFLTSSATSQDLSADRTWNLSIVTGSILPTTNQVNVSGTGKILGSDITLSLPQNIHTTATPSFTQIVLGSAGGTSGAVRGDRSLTFQSTAFVTSSQTSAQNLTSNRTWSFSLRTGSISGTTNQVNIVGSGVVVGNNLTLSLPQDIGMSSSVQFGTITTTGSMYINGDLFVYGTETIIDVDNVTISDPHITLNTSGSDFTANEAGLHIYRDSTFGSLVFDSTKTSYWKVGLLGSEIEIVNLSSNQTLTGKTWNSNIIEVLYGGTGLSSVATNHILYGNGTGALLTSSNLRFDGSVFNVTGSINVDNIQIDGNTISSTNTNGNIVLNANGTGVVDVKDNMYVTGSVFINGSTNKILFNKVDNSRGRIEFSDGDSADLGIAFQTSGATFRFYTKGDKGYITRAGTDTSGIILDNSGNVGIKTVSPSYTLDVTGTLGASTSITTALLDVDNIQINGNTISSTNTDGNITLDANGIGFIDIKDNLLVTGSSRFKQEGVFDTYLSSPTFASGFAGNGWRIRTEGSTYELDIDNLTVRGRMRVYELLINQIRATNGSIFVSSTGKVKTASLLTGALGVSGSTYAFTTDTDTNHGFLEDDLIRAQRFTGNGLYQLNMTVTNVPNLTTFTASLAQTDAYIDNISKFVDVEFVRLGNTTDTSRQGAVYMSADDSGAPFIDIVDGVASFSDWNTATVHKVRLGNLSGIVDADIPVPITGYGLYSENVFLKGSIVANSGNIGGWSLDTNRIYKGDVELNSSAQVIKLGQNASMSGSGVFLSGSGEFNLQSDTTDYIRQSSGNLIISSNNFALSGSTTLRMNNQKLVLGTSADSQTLSSGTGTFLSSSGVFRFGIGGGNRVEYDGTNLTVDVASFNLQAGNLYVVGNGGSSYIRMGSITGTDPNTTNTGFYADNSGNLLLKAGVTANKDYLRFVSGAMTIHSTAFVLSGSTTLLINTSKIALGANASALTVAGTSTGSVIDSAGGFLSYGSANNYIRRSGDSLDIKAGTFNLVVGNTLAVNSATGGLITLGGSGATYALSNIAFSGSGIGKIGSIDINGNSGGRLYVGTGTFNNTNTGFYLSGSGQFSLKNTFAWDGTNLTISGSTSRIQTPEFFLGGALNYISGSNGTLAIRSQDFVLSASSTLVLNTLKFALGTSANTQTISSGDGVFMSASGQFRVGNTTEYIRFGNTAGVLEIQTPNLTVDASGNVEANNMTLDGVSTADLFVFRQLTITTANSSSHYQTVVDSFSGLQVTRLLLHETGSNFVRINVAPPYPIAYIKLPNSHNASVVIEPSVSDMKIASNKSNTPTGTGSVSFNGRERITHDSHNWAKNLYQDDGSYTNIFTGRSGVRYEFFASANDIKMQTATTFDRLQLQDVTATDLFVTNVYATNLFASSSTAIVYANQILASSSIGVAQQNRVAIWNASGVLNWSGITTTELNYLDNVTSDIQTQINSKANTATTLTFNTSNFLTTDINTQNLSSDRTWNLSITTGSIIPTSNQVNVSGTGKILGSDITLSLPQNIHTSASPTFSRLTLSTASGVSPLIVTSTTVITNLNADMLDGLHASSFIQDDGGVTNEIAFWKDGNTLSGSSQLTWTNDTLSINGTLEASVKSFNIKHPTKENKRLIYGVVEAPEHSVFVRGKVQSNVIELPEEWTGLVHEYTITVQLTPIGTSQKLVVHKIEDNKVYIKNKNWFKKSINAFYFVQAERKDVAKLITERNI